jgi:CBS-domain-containing membrane protein
VADLFGANVPAMALADENCRIIATRLAVHGLERLPVVTDAQSRRLVGIVARSDLVKPSLAVGEEEQHAERVFEPSLGRARARFRALTQSSRAPEASDDADA